MIGISYIYPITHTYNDMGQKKLRDYSIMVAASIIPRVIIILSKIYPSGYKGIYVIASICPDFIVYTRIPKDVACLVSNIKISFLIAVVLIPLSQTN
jgi:hypothetical protein